MWPSTDRLFGYEQIRHLCRSTNVFFVFSSQHGTVTTLRIIASKKIPPDDSCCKDLFIPQTSKQQAVCQSTSPGLLAGGRRPQTHTEIHEHKHRASSHISTVADCFFFCFFFRQLFKTGNAPVIHTNGSEGSSGDKTELNLRCERWCCHPFTVLSGCYYLCFFPQQASYYKQFIIVLT